MTRKGYKQSPAHIAKRKRFGPEHHSWIGDQVSAKGGRTRALRLYPESGPCVRCGSPRAERHHRNGNTADNRKRNVIALCRKCQPEVPHGSRWPTQERAAASSTQSAEGV